MIATEFTSQEYAAFFVFFGTPVVLAIVILLLVGLLWDMCVKHEWLSNIVSTSILLVLIFTGYFVHHALLLLVLWYLVEREIRKQRRRRGWKSSTAQLDNNKENRVSEPVSVNIEVVREAPEPPESFRVYLPKQRTLPQATKISRQQSR
jgi:amino acid permease